MRQTKLTRDSEYSKSNTKKSAEDMCNYKGNLNTADLICKVVLWIIMVSLGIILILSLLMALDIEIPQIHSFAVFEHIKAIFVKSFRQFIFGYGEVCFAP